jgi:hypothetical protein
LKVRNEEDHMMNDPTPYPGPDDDDNDGADWLNDIRQNIRTTRQTDDRLPECPYRHEGVQCDLRIHPMDVPHYFPPVSASWLEMTPADFSAVPVQGALFPESDAAPAPVMF